MFSFDPIIRDPIAQDSILRNIEIVLFLPNARATYIYSSISHLLVEACWIYLTKERCVQMMQWFCDCKSIKRALRNGVSVVRDGDGEG